MANKQSRNGARRSVPPLADLLTDLAPAQASERRKEERISFAGDWPEDGIPAVRQAVETARGRADGADADGNRATHPSTERLRELLAVRLAGRGLPVEAGELALAPQGEPVIAWIARGLLRPGDAVLVESPAPPNCLQAFRSAGAVVVQVPCDEDGMRPEYAERLAEAHRPKLAHVMPALGNPAGRVWSAARREAMLDLGRRCGMVLLEDDAYGQWRSGEAEREASLYAMSAKTADGGVIYAGTFAAALGPELPVGWAAADPGIRARLAALPRTPAAEEPDAGGSAEAMLLRLLDGGKLDELLRQLSVSYSERMYRLDALLRERHWSGASWTLPKGGPFLWLTLPEGLDADALLRAAKANGVAFDPGAPFYAADPPRNRLRLSVAGAAGDRLDEGFARLAETMDAFLARS
ncbi:PLP-dependent aminotransferase family protein [Paenibacillus sp. MWE-103]|uniref:PLP-dependent aminotransferase family protein n=1 Tax=Paenibacillus artemisiicola TaxID=1172618 RepID=A0ABS3WAA9_9BACL|nr:PLP-dependent aminotransferase family protein [Paenibacillus artemisiicola]MBO7745264.1 PLP-dependent aminotransferase family protein [Paenibacillus artemisiicola]